MSNILKAKAISRFDAPKDKYFPKAKRHDILIHRAPPNRNMHLQGGPIDVKNAVKDVMCRSWLMLTQRERERERGECIYRHTPLIYSPLQLQYIVYTLIFKNKLQSICNAFYCSSGSCELAFKGGVLPFFEISSYTHYIEILFMLGSSVYQHLSMDYFHHGTATFNLNTWAFFCPLAQLRRKKRANNINSKNATLILASSQFFHQNCWLFSAAHWLLLFPKIWELALLVGESRPLLTPASMLQHGFKFVISVRCI